MESLGCKAAISHLGCAAAPRIARSLLPGLRIPVSPLKHGRSLLIRASSPGNLPVSNGNGQRKKNDALQETIFQLEGLLKEPGEVLNDIGEQLSAKDLQLVLSYFAEEGRDSWFALEVFEWMQKTNRVENDTHQLMMSIMVNWAMKLVEQEKPVEQVKALLEDMYCVGLTPESRIMHSIVAAYWEKGKASEALTFVKEVMSSKWYQDRADDPLQYLIVKMVSSKQSKQAIRLVTEVRNGGLLLKGTTYSAAMLAAVHEQEQLSFAVHQLRKYQKKGVISIEGSDKSIRTYEASLHRQAEQFTQWAAEDEQPQELMPTIYERLLAMYCLAGKGLDAERSLWKLKLAGRSPAPSMFNTILGICAFNNRAEDAYRIFGKMEASGREATKLTFSVLIGGFIKGGNPAEAASAMSKMLERGLRPEVPEMLVVLRSLRSADMVPLYMKLAKTLSDEGLMEPRIMYFYIDSIKLCIIRLL
ncbi:hypothetical protein SELMODRAFT_427387 [Selaginella moellendorffii]|uniref:Pentacotripeptide-repeat region of PRORP domain-containing protein n=1 Tax=Selaginella moellendorffii TaxID=88036 RepID=D8SZF4_SELML|nr:pentatricopeptide repeat-containing protein At2g30100, chloroplastic [Selaginella moellendorffii]EFJ10204.1 hypothetical protein SELMODRAFT_427387 [Selaginella moellendorffii]|eukprot:XP_002988693.1 pentatricopeptide repeat-containing protein At2g30100, chloroplastic [Selaginella moellendorffii]